MRSGLVKGRGSAVRTMDWLKDVLRQYAGAPGGGSVALGQDPSVVERDFDQVARVAPRDDLSDGLAAAFRSEQTPPFPEMLGSLFGRSPGLQRAGILQMLASALGPSVLAQILGKRGLGGVLRDGQAEQINPEVAARIPPEAVTEAAQQAEKKDPSIIDRLSRVYAEQPQLIKTLGAAALAIAMARVAQRKGTL